MTRQECKPFTAQNGPCQCAGEGAGAVVQAGAAGNWFVTMGHAGFNTRANNGGGYISEKAARAAVKRYQGASTRALFADYGR
jgi:hypothetical protein